MKRLRRVLGRTLLFLGLTVLAFAALEGIFGAVFLGLDLFRSARDAGLHSQRTYLEPDTLLGWRTIPNLHLPDLWAPGSGLASNSRGFREAREVGARVPEGTSRIVCLGDSFTFGIGVANDETWCAMLGAREGLESVNLGEAGYGIGQAMLKYERDASGIPHDVVIVAPIAEDFRRVGLRRFVGYERPYFSAEDGGLVVENVPVPRTSRLRVWATLNRALLQRFHVFRAGRRVLDLVPGAEPARASRTDAPPELVARLLLARLRDTVEARGASLILALLPSGVPDPMTQDWKLFLAGFAEANGVPFVDLYSPHEGRLRAERARMFSTEWGHFSVEGNRWVADRLEPVVRRVTADADARGDDAPRTEGGSR